MSEAGCSRHGERFVIQRQRPSQHQKQWSELLGASSFTQLVEWGAITGFRLLDDVFLSAVQIPVFTAIFPLHGDTFLCNILCWVQTIFRSFVPVFRG